MRNTYSTYWNRTAMAKKCNETTTLTVKVQTAQIENQLEKTANLTSIANLHWEKNINEKNKKHIFV